MLLPPSSHFIYIPVVFILGIVIGLAFLVIHIMAMIKASQGQMWKLPVIGDIAEKNS